MDVWLTCVNSQAMRFMGCLDWEFGRRGVVRCYRKSTLRGDREHSG